MALECPRLRDQVEVAGLNLAAIPRGLLLHHFDLLVDNLAGEAIDRHMYPVVLFAFDNEIVGRLLAFGLKWPVWAITSINKFHVRVWSTSPKARAISSRSVLRHCRSPGVLFVRRDQSGQLCFVLKRRSANEGSQICCEIIGYRRGQRDRRRRSGRPRTRRILLLNGFASMAAKGHGCAELS